MRNYERTDGPAVRERKKGDMTEGPITRQLVLFALPLFVGALFQLMYNTTDSVILGKFVGADALAAIGATGTTAFGLMNIAIGVTNAFTVVISQLFGAGKHDQVRRAVANAMWISLVLGILLGFVGFFGARPIMRLLGTPENIMEPACMYVMIYGGLIIGQVFYNAASAILKALGDSKTPLYFLIFCSLLNIVLDLAFVLIWEGGVPGVAWATVISQILSAVLCMAYMFARYPQLRFGREELKIDRRLMREMLRIGVPLGITNGLLSVGMMVVTGVVNSFGSDIVAVYTVGGKVSQIATVTFSQLAFSFSVFAGQNFGAKKYDRILEGSRKALRMVVGLSLLSTVVIILAANQVALLFLNAGETEILAGSAQMIRIQACFYVFLGAIWVYNSALRGVGDVRTTVYSSIVELCAKVGLSVLLARLVGYVGIWFAEPIGWILGLLVSGIVFCGKKWMGRAEFS